MPARRRPISPADAPARFINGHPPAGGHLALTIDWSSFLRRIERKRRMLIRLPDSADAYLPREYYLRATYSSFRLEGLDVTEADVREALEPGADRPMLRSRQSHRLRNHAAILHHIETDLRAHTAMTGDTVIRWYTAVSAGLSTTALDHATTVRIEELVRRINSPHLRVQAALQEVASIHAALVADPLVPSFNGILARLVLRYHLGRCRLPPIFFDPLLDIRPLPVDALLQRMIQLLEASYDELLRRR